MSGVNLLTFTVAVPRMALDGLDAKTIRVGHFQWRREVEERKLINEPSATNYQLALSISTDQSSKRPHPSLIVA